MALPSVDGMFGSMPFLWWTELTSPAVQFVYQQFTLNERGPAEQNIAYLVSWGAVDSIIETYIRTVNRVGSLDAVTGADIRETVEAMDYSILGGLMHHRFEEGMRDATRNRIAVLKYANTTMSGPATGPDDALLIDNPAGGKLFVPIVVPLDGLHGSAAVAGVVALTFQKIYAEGSANGVGLCLRDLTPTDFYRLENVEATDPQCLRAAVGRPIKYDGNR